MACPDKNFTEQSKGEQQQIHESGMMMHQQLQHQQSPCNNSTIQLILIRHGIALHNIIHHHHQQQQRQRQQQQQHAHVPVENDHETNLHMTDENYLFDPPLTVDGKIQAVIIGETIRQFIFQQQQQLQQQTLECWVVTSPLTRCLQTSMYAFGIPQEYDTAITTTTSYPSTTIHCHENLREACGIYNCDRRRTKTQLQQRWGHIVQFIHHDSSDSSHMSSDHDTLWHRTHRETIHELQCRIAQFMTWLLSSLSSLKRSQHQHQPQQQQQHDNANIFVLVTHGVWIETMLQMYDPTWSIGTVSGTTAIPGGKRRIQNADIYYTECNYTTTSNTAPKRTISNICLQNVRQIPTHYGPR